MTTLFELEKWSEKHHKLWMDFLRVLLGLIILIKGFTFIADTFTLSKLLQQNFGINSVLLVEFLAFMHLLLGFFIIIGLGTRIACALMTPILVAAVFYVNTAVGVIGSSEWLLSVFTLFLLIFFFFEGSGRFSVYYYLINSKRSRLTDESESEHKGHLTAEHLDDDGNID